MKTVVYIIVLCSCFLLSCTERQDYSEMKNLLEQAEGMNRDYVSMDTLQGIEELTDYFMAHGSEEERIRANYIMGSVYRDRGDSPMALEYFLKAVNQADTTAADCNHELLSHIYAQMAQLFHQQRFPQKEIEMWNAASSMALKANDSLTFLAYHGRLASTFHLMSDSESSFQTADDVYRKYRELGRNDLAASYAIILADYYLSHDSLEKANNLINEYIHDSGLVDAKGNVAQGKEIFYYYCGLYYEKSGQLEKALQYYKKLEQTAKILMDYEGCYKGQMSVYQALGKSDSVFKYAQLFADANDSANAKNSADEVSRVQSLYDYTAHKQRALEKTEENHALWRIIFIAVVAIMASLSVIGMLFSYYRLKERKRKRKILELEQDLNNAKVVRAEISEELRQLKDKDYESVIAAKEERLAELTETIEQLSQGGVAREKDNLEQFQNSEIAALFVKKATEKTEKVQPTEAEWKLLLSQFSQDNPATFKAFGTGKALSKLEQRICILLVLDIPEYVIAIMTDSSASTVSNSKARANEKLFGKKDARTLKINLIHAMKA